MHHIKGNLYADRVNERGDVRLTRLVDKAPDDLDFRQPLPHQYVVMDMLIDPFCWARMVSSVSTRGEGADFSGYYHALENHQNPASPQRRHIQAIAQAYETMGETGKAVSVLRMTDADLHRALALLISDYQKLTIKEHVRANQPVSEK